VADDVDSSRGGISDDAGRVHRLRQSGRQYCRRHRHSAGITIYRTIPQLFFLSVDAIHSLAGF